MRVVSQGSGSTPVDNIDRACLCLCAWEGGINLRGCFLGSGREGCSRDECMIMHGGGEVQRAREELQPIPPHTVHLPAAVACSPAPATSPSHCAPASSCLLPSPSHSPLTLCARQHLPAPLLSHCSPLPTVCSHCL